MKTKVYKVIDGDNMQLLYTFFDEQRDRVLQRYRQDVRFNSVEVDHDGDIICFEDSDTDE